MTVINPYYILKLFFIKYGWTIGILSFIGLIILIPLIFKKDKALKKEVKDYI